MCCHPFISGAFECEKPQIGDSVLEGLISMRVGDGPAGGGGGWGRLPVSKSEPYH